MQNPPPGASQGSYPPPGKPSGGSGLDPKIAAALSYIWIVGIIFFFIEKEDRFVRFHALQSILYFITFMVTMVVLAVLAFILTFAFGIGGAIVGGGLGMIVHLLVWVIWLIFWVIGLAMLIGLIFAAVKAYQGQKFKLPIIGNMAENIVNK
ncbi:MAG TPA: DUF4870 domain-containing protein [Pyrinomonadaceae bacterium]|jgi:uncharacterized membrane protein